MCLTAANEESSPLFLPQFSLLFCFFLSVKLCCFMKEEIILETSCLQFVPKTRAPSPKQPVEGGRCWGRCVVWAGPHQGPQRWAPSWSQGRTGAQPSGPPSPQHLLTGHQQSHEKSHRTFSLIFPGPEILSQPVEVPMVRGTPVHQMLASQQ